MTPEELEQLKFLLNKAIVKLDISVTDTNILRAAKEVILC